MKTKRFLYLLVLCLLAALPAHGKVRLPQLVSDGIVFQRNAPITVWGWADPGERITLTFLNKTYKARASKQGEWRIVLPEQAAGGPYTLTVNEQTVRDILIGEVWLCSGQSNMETPMSRVAEMFPDEIAAINNPLIRHFKTALRYDVDGAADDLQGEWKAATPDNIPAFSATAYFFGKYLYEHLRVPIGLFNSSVGGSPIEAWLSPETARTFPDLARQLEQLTDRSLQDSLRNALREARAGAPRTEPPVDAGAGKWLRADWDDADWQHIYLPGYWGEKGIAFRNGVIWLRKTVEVPASWDGRAGTLRLGTMVESDSAFVNGHYVGNTGYQYPPRRYDVPAGVLKAGKNVIALRLTGNARGGWVEEKPYKLMVDDESIDLVGDWKYRVGHDAPPPSMMMPSGGRRNNRMPPPTPGQNSPTALFNAMIAPARHYTVRGVVWYQGEANAGQTLYGERFKALTDTWRTTFANLTLPVVYVQLPNYMKPERYQERSTWALTRDVQRRALTLPHVGMVVTLGLGEWNDIHPLNKRDLGYRLALQARRIAYGETGFVSRSPQLAAVETGVAGDLLLTFDTDGSQLYANTRLRGFFVAGADGKYAEAEATPIAYNKVKVWSAAVPQPVSVRYAWADNPMDANLMNVEGMPVGTFEEKLTLPVQKPLPLVYEVEHSGAAFPAPLLPPLAQLPVVETLPDPFAWADGSGRSTDFGDWSRRRAEIIRQLEHYEIGQKPPVERSNIRARMEGDSLVAEITRNGETLRLTAHITYPAGGTAPYPAIIGIGRGSGSLPPEIFADRNIAQIAFNFAQVMSHTQTRGKEPINRLYPELEAIGAYSAWPWGVSRIIDALEIVGADSRIDLRHLAVSGCSFAGKMALFAGALDERIALTIAQEPGGGGAAAWRVSETLGNVETLGRTNYAWFLESMAQFKEENVSRLPIDHHELCALVAPRALLIMGNTDYEWLADEAGYVSARAARKVWETFGISDRMGYSVVGGHPHCMVPAVQRPEVEAFVDKFLLDKTDVDTRVTVAPLFEQVDYAKWMPW
jgi:sialate O-acetylesterase